MAWSEFASSKGNPITQPQIGIIEGSCTPEQSASKSNETSGLFSLIVAFLMTVVAFLGPFSVIISEAYFSITAVAWNADVSITGVYFFWMSPAQWFMSLPVTFLRFYYVYQMKLLYDGKTTQKRALKFGILSECPPLIFGIVTSLPLLFIPGYLYAFMPIPIPELLLIGLIFMKVIPPPKEPLSWIEKQDEPLQ